MARDDLGRWVPGGNDIDAPVSGGHPASTDEPATPALSPEDNAPADDPAKVAQLDHHRGRHAGAA
jgi:hypothetical protein